eukprot:TRINITY_DN84155_c0_g1_i1.p1 TRINITY_DN84155_c0_g1~~TRINITY_DN84155_c0_g1_i1.p1  ORF type:complete len:239 (-),score=32.80 TRINITY_DN84155_c0_g1_i1:5-664(-)
MGGCVASRRYNSDMASLHASIHALQEAIEERNRQISRLHEQIDTGMTRTSTDLHAMADRQSQQAQQLRAVVQQLERRVDIVHGDVAIAQGRLEVAGAAMENQGKKFAASAADLETRTVALEGRVQALEVKQSPSPQQLRRTEEANPLVKSEAGARQLPAQADLWDMADAMDLQAAAAELLAAESSGAEYPYFYGRPPRVGLSPSVVIGGRTRRLPRTYL